MNSTIIEITKRESLEKLNEIKFLFNESLLEDVSINKDICVYACGSLGRHEMTQNSDLDLFFVTMHDEEQNNQMAISNLDKYIFFAKLYEINKKLGYQEPSKKGLYWDFISIRNLLDIGSRQEDFNNSFTTRMLLILESKPIYNEKAYNQLVTETVDKYFIDYKTHSGEFYPLFLMNDILRYWYTLTLNYEYRRDDSDDQNKKNWKRLKLKYARLITCFSMLACLYKKSITPDYVIECIKMTPFERLNMLASINEDIASCIEKVEREYEWFLDLRKEEPEWWTEKANKESALSHAENFHELVVHNLMKELSNTNPELRRRTDVY